MDIDTVTAALQRELDRIPALEAVHAGQPTADIRTLLVNHDLAKSFQPALEQEEEFQENNLTMLNPAIGHGATFSAYFVAPMLVREAQSRGSAEAATRWLAKVLAAQRAEGIEVQTLYGLQVTSPTPLAEGIALLRLGDLPKSAHFQSLIGGQALSQLPMPVPPTSAIVRKFVAQPVRLPLSEVGASQIQRSSGSIEDEELMLCLAQAGPTRVVPGPRWSEFTDPDIQAAVMGTAMSVSHQELVAIHTPDVEVDLGSVADFIAQYAGLTVSDKGRVRTALGRLHSAMVRSEPGDRAVELSIALETMLMSGERGDNRHKVGLRAALLTSTTALGLKQSRALVNAGYDIRSALMHTGAVKKSARVPGLGNLESNEIVTRVSAITAAVLRRIVDGGSFPDWNAIELSGGSLWTSEDDS